MSHLLTSVKIPARATHTATVIWFHGLGDTGSGWSFLGDQLSELLPHVKWIFPNAPVQPVTLNGGFKMPAWYDIAQLDKSILEREDKKGIQASIDSINKVIQKELDDHTNVPSERIIVGGFSQGCAIALLTSLLSKHKFGGVVGCSGYLPMADEVKKNESPENKTTDILMCHGTADPVVRYEYGQQTSETLKALGYNVSFKSYEGMGHSANEQELADIAVFVKKQLP